MHSIALTYLTVQMAAFQGIEALFLVYAEMGCVAVRHPETTA